MIAIPNVAGERIAVFGLGRSGLAAAYALKKGGADVRAWDESPDARDNAESEGLELHDLAGRDAFAGVSRLIVSPGIPHLYPEPNGIIANACFNRVPLDNDVGIFFRSLEAFARAEPETGGPVVIAVTGSNGKSTTSALVNHILSAAGRQSQLAGNIGRGIFDLDPIRPDQVLVLELSSYQLELAGNLDPDIAVFLNLSADHLGRHGGMGGYFAAKRRLFRGARLKRAIIGVDEPEGLFLAGRVEARIGPEKVVRLSVAEDFEPLAMTVSRRGSMLVETNLGQPVQSIDLGGIQSLAGAHNLQNAGAALSACRACGLTSDEIESGMRSFPGLEHRSQIVGEFNGVLCVNDSKATNVESASMSLQSYPRIRWIAGGLGKESGIQPIANRLNNVVKAYLIGKSAADFAKQLGEVPYTICHTMSKAVELAVADSSSGDTLLLAPAAASQDQYRDFEERGRHFIKEVRRRFDSGKN